MRTGPVCIFAEDFDSRLTHGEGALIVSLAPKVSYQLAKAGVRYAIPEDSFNILEWMDTKIDFFDEQLAWLGRLDGFLKRTIRLCGENQYQLARACYLRLKYLVDYAVIQSRTVRTIMDKLQPSKVVYVGREVAPETRKSIFYPWFRDHCTVWEFLSAYASKERNLELVFLDGDRTGGTQRTTAEDWRVRLKRSILGQTVKRTLRFFKYEKWSAWGGRRPTDQRLNFLFLDAGSPEIDRLMRACLRSGHRVYIKNETVIYSVNDFMEKKVWRLGERDWLPNQRDEVFREAREAYAQLVSDKHLLNWIYEQCGMNVSGFLLPYIENFIVRICPQILLEAEAMKKFYSDCEIDFVVARTSVSLNAVAPLIAARTEGRVKTVCFQHACVGVQERIWYPTELDLFDYYFASNGLSEQEFREAIEAGYPSRCRVFQSAFYFDAFRKRQNRRFKEKGTKTVLYLPKKIPTFARHFDNVMYPLTWYFEFQKRLLELFASRKDYHFIYKHQKQQRWAEQGILQYLREQGSRNIEIVDGNTSEYLNGVDRVLLDYPATGIFEMAAAGIPVLSLHWKGYKPLPHMAQAFGPSLQSFGSIEEALARVQDFLDRRAEEFRVNLPLAFLNPLDILEGLGRTSPASGSETQEENAVCRGERA